MKVLRKAESILWQFRCDRCRSDFEMTDEEKKENDRKYDESCHKDDPNHTPHNPLNYFDCPVCNCKRLVRRNEMHKIIVMDDGSHHFEY